MKLHVYYGIKNLTKDQIKSYQDNSQLIKSATFNTNIVIAPTMARTRILNPDNFLIDKYGLADDLEVNPTLIYYTDIKKPAILPDEVHSFSLDFNIEDVAEFELSYGDTYYCRRFVSVEYLKKLYSKMEVIIPDTKDMDSIYFENTLVMDKEISLNLPVCYWNDQGIICNNSLPFLFIHTHLEYIPVVFIVNKNHVKIVDEMLPTPYFTESVKMEISNPVVNTFTDMFIKQGNYYRFTTNLNRFEIAKAVTDLSEFHIPKDIELELKKFGIIQTLNIFPSLRLTQGKSQLSSNELAYRWFMKNEIDSFPVVFSGIEDPKNPPVFPEYVKTRMLNCNDIQTPEILSTFRRITYKELFKLIEPVLLDTSLITDLSPDERIGKEHSPIRISKDDKNLHILLLAGLDIINGNILRHFSQDDEVPVMIHYYDLPFINENFKRKILA